jgi:hypothetical protein
VTAAELAGHGEELPPPVPAVWTVERLRSHTGRTWDATVVRNTQGWQFDVDRKVYEAGHGMHGGWYATPDGIVQCAGTTCPEPCDEALFPLASIAPRHAAARASSEMSS